MICRRQMTKAQITRRQALRNAPGQTGPAAVRPAVARGGSYSQAAAQRRTSVKDVASVRQRVEEGKRLFPDTETGEYPSQQIVRGELAGDFAQRLLRQPQLFRQQLARPGAQQLRLALLKMSRR